MHRSVKFAVVGVVLIVAGFVLDAFAKWYYYQSILSQYGNPPPPIAPIAFTAFIFLVPIGIIFLVYSIYLFFKDNRVTIEKR